MEQVFNLAWLIIVFPIIGLLINTFAGRDRSETEIGLTAVIASAASFIMSLLVIVALFGLSPEARAEGVDVPLYTFFSIGNTSVVFGLKIDTLTAVMLMVVTFVGTLIHIYSIGYMHGDSRYQRFFVYMNLFMASMLILVLGSSYLMMFIGWEGVGLCSFLLIGFWFEKDVNSAAARKAMVANRVGDYGVMLAMLAMFIGIGTLQYTGVFDAASHGEVSTGLATLVTLLMLIGVTGKSAQIPLYVWLPDAMAGPTPVSALIHAATMVTAGVYLIARSHPLFALVPGVEQFVGVLGAATAFLAGSIAIAQFDIKKVLAYSTVSQLGFMVSAVGLGATVAGIFHLMTHAFFKGLLFLGAGSVIHGMEHGMHHENAHGDPQDMRNMGGLWGKMRTTAITYIIAALALGGVFPFAGFWSKDEILFEVQQESPLAYWLLVIAAAFTAFYMTRQVLMVFFGEPRHKGAEHAVESSRWMTIPLMILAAFAAIAGFLNISGGLTHWLAPDEHFAGLNAATALTSTGIAVLAIVAGYLIYRPRPTVEGAPDDPLRRTGFVFSLLNHKYWIDELYDRLVVRPFTWLANFLAMVVDGRFWHDFFHETILYGGFMALTKFLANPIDTLVIDGAVNGTGRLVAWVSGGLRKVQTGFVRNYALMMLGGVAIVIAWFALMALRGG